MNPVGTRDLDPMTNTSLGSPWEMTAGHSVKLAKEFKAHLVTETSLVPGSRTLMTGATWCPTLTSLFYSQQNSRSENNPCPFAQKVSPKCDGFPFPAVLEHFIRVISQLLLLISRI